MSAWPYQLPILEPREICRRSRNGNQKTHCLAAWAELERLRPYEAELTPTATALQRLRPLGEVKAVGLREVAALAWEVSGEMIRLRARVAELEAARPQWRDRPTCAGWWVQDLGRGASLLVSPGLLAVSHDQVNDPAYCRPTSGICYFGPIPAPEDSHE